jgi:tetratricopeptide (TPR) repeat protein
MQEAALDSTRHAAHSSQAMEQWMRGDHLMRHYMTRPEVLQARQHFEAALVAEPRSINALVGLAQTHHAEVLRRWRIGDEKAASLARAKALALSALSIDPNHPGAMVTLGGVLSFANEFEEAERVLQRALVLNPNSAAAHRDFGGLKYFTARFEEVQPHIDTALRLNPLELGHVWQCQMILGDSLMHLGKDQAHEHHRLAALANPTLSNPYFSKASHAAQKGQLDEARKQLAQALRMSPTWTIAQSVAAERSHHPAYLAARARYRQGLRQAGLPEQSPPSNATAPLDAPASGAPAAVNGRS